MKKNIIYKNFISASLLNNRKEKKLRKEFDSILKNVQNSLDYPQNFFHTLSKKFKFNFDKKDLHKYRKFKSIVIIGMGGSILGSEAIYHFLKDNLKKDFLFFNDIDIGKFKKNKKTNSLYIIISKSGSTIETLSNLLSLGIIKKKAKNMIIISEKNNNPLYEISKKMQLHHIAHRKYIGGRYSVLSEVGIIPAILMGINIDKIRKNLLTHFKSNKKFLKDSTIKLTNIYQRNCYKNLILLNYIPQLEKFLFWSQQLIAESLGKKGKGFLPTISNVPKDHHSLLQLYLDGPKDKLFYIFSEETHKKSKILNTKGIDVKLNFLRRKTLSQIKNAQKNALIKTLKKKNIPFREFKIKNLNEETLGELLSYFMMETAIIGKLAKINPFNQPAVEEIKVDTKKFLK